MAAARAAGRAGTGYILSTISGHKLEDVKAGSSGPVFYQLYLMGGRGAAEAVIERARVAGFSALVVTIDTPVSGIRERDYRNGMKELISGGPCWKKFPIFRKFFRARAGSSSYLLDGGLPGLPNVIIPGKGQMPLVDINAALAESTPTWADLAGSGKSGKVQSSSKACSRPTMRAAPSMKESRQFRFRIMADASSTAFPHLCGLCPK